MRICAIVSGNGPERTDDPRSLFLKALLDRLRTRHAVELILLRTPRSAGVGVGRVTAVRRVLQSHWRHRFDAFHAFDASEAGVVALVASRLVRRPMVVHIMGPELETLPQLQHVEQSGKKTERRFRLNTVLKLAHAVTAPSTGLVARAATMSGQVECVPVGVDPSFWYTRAPRPLAEAPYRLIHVGCLQPRKNQSILLSVMAYLRRTDFPVLLDVVGQDQLDGEIQRHASEMGVDDVVTFHGQVDQERLRDLMTKAHLLVHTSLQEAGPQVVREAAVLGVPTVGTNVGYVADWAPVGALALSGERIAAFATAIKELLRDDDRRFRMAQSAQETALTQDVDWTVDRFSEIYERIRNPRRATAR